MSRTDAIAATFRSQGVGRHRAALLGLGVVIVFLAAFGVWSAHVTSDSASRSGDATRLSDAYQRARFAVGQEESLERKYRLEPGVAVRAKYTAAGADLVAALETVGRIGLGHDRARVARLLKVHRVYLDTTRRLFAAVDAGDRAKVLSIDNTQTDPAFSSIATRVEAEARMHRSAALASLGDLRRTERFAVIATPTAFGLGLALLAFFTFQLAAMYRQLRGQAEESEHNALHDALTGLPNRRSFTETLERQIEASAEVDGSCSLLSIDLDRFKEINDTLGHATGDHLLREIGPRLLPLLAAGDRLARLGGDEFGVVLAAADHAQAEAVAKQMIEGLHEPFALAGMSVTVDASIGIVTFPEHGGDAETLVRNADSAMYLAKTQRSGAALYDPATDVYNPQRLALVGELRAAIAADALELHYQPKFIVADHHVAGVEALVRWRHPTRGMLPPDEFIGLAEHTGLIKPLTLLVLRKATRQCREWNALGLDLSVAVNLSVANLLDIDLVDDVARILEAEGLAPERLELEITESMVMSDPERAMAQLGRLSAMGIQLSIDDYGTGHASLAYLRHLPVNVLKIDRSFVTDLATDAGDRAIVRSTIDLAHNLGLRVVAEGVEDEEALVGLTRLGCDHAQGFHLCRPMPPDLLIIELRRFARTSSHPPQDPPFSAAVPLSPQPRPA